MVTFEITVITFLILLNAFFAMSEMAIISSSNALLRQKAKQGNKRARLALQLSENSGRFLSTVQAGITLVSTLAGAYGGAEIADKIAPFFNQFEFITPYGELMSLILVVATISYFSVVIGELIPKQFALSNPEKLAMLVAKPMHFLSVIFTPIVLLFEFSAKAFFKLFGIQCKPEKITETEVRAMLAEATICGTIEKAEHDMFTRIIRLDDRNVESIMTHRVDIVFIDINDSIATIRQKIHEAGHSRYPVVNNDTTKVIGIVQAKELLDAALNNCDNLNISDYLREANFLAEGTKCMKVLELFKVSPAHIMIIVDEYGLVQGIVTASDILEAIVGVMESNYEHPLITRRDDGTWLVDGITSIDEIHLSIGIEEICLDSSFETIAGFMIDVLGHIPITAEAIERFGYRFEVMDMDGQQIDKILISKVL